MRYFDSDVSTIAFSAPELPQSSNAIIPGVLLEGNPLKIEAPTVVSKSVSSDSSGSTPFDGELRLMSLFAREFDRSSGKFRGKDTVCCNISVFDGAGTNLFKVVVVRIAFSFDVCDVVDTWDTWVFVVNAVVVGTLSFGRSSSLVSVRCRADLLVARSDSLCEVDVEDFAESVVEADCSVVFESGALRFISGSK